MKIGTRQDLRYVVRALRLIEFQSNGQANERLRQIANELEDLITPEIADGVPVFPETRDLLIPAPKVPGHQGSS